MKPEKRLVMRSLPTETKDECAEKEKRERSQPFRH